MNLVEIATLDTAIEADLAWMRLDGAGIPATLLDNQLASMRGPSNIHRARLMVPEEFAVQARALLAAEEASVTEPVPEDLAAQEELFDEDDNEPCPACGASHTEYVSRSINANLLVGFIGWILTALPLPVNRLTNNMRCQGCGHEWKLGS